MSGTGHTKELQAGIFRVSATRRGGRDMHVWYSLGQPRSTKATAPPCVGKSRRSSDFRIGFPIGNTCDRAAFALRG
jgi:hypothetical protein